MLRRLQYAAAAVACGCFCLVPGCRNVEVRPWQVVVQNKTGLWCEVNVATGPGPDANAPDLGPQERRVLRSGTENLVVHSAKIVYNRQEHVIRPEIEVQPGKICLIVIEADGQVKAEVSDPS